MSETTEPGGIALLAGLDAVLALTRALHFGRPTSLADVVANARPVLSALAVFDFTGVIDFADQGLSARVVECEPTGARGELESEVDALVESGIFGRALYANQLVVVPACRDGHTLVLHPLASRSSIFGMFVGRMTGEGRKLPRAVEQMLSLVMLVEGAVVETVTLERALADHGRQLDGLVADRTRTLLEARDAAQASSRAKSEFLANVSHELRTPMNGILGMLDMLLATPIGGEQREYAETARRCTLDLLAQLNDVLDVSRIEAGGVVLEEVGFDLERVCEDVAAVVRPTAEHKGIGVVVEHAVSAPGRLIGDPGRLRQVLLNLVGNAVKFTAEGAVRLGIEAIAAAGERVRVRLVVEDSGIGIPADRLDAIFEPFAQADASTAREFGGTGLGLSISRGFVRLMGGELGVRSQPGIGSTFWIEVPFNRAPAAAVAEPRRRQTAPVPRFDARVLLAEDNPVNQRVAELFLRRLGCDVDVAADGIEALARFTAARYDLVLMDCQMPRADGYETTEALRRLEDGQRRTPVIALTANAFASDRQRCLASGMDDYLSKPFTLVELATVLGRWLQARPSAGTDSASLAPGPATA